MLSIRAHDLSFSYSDAAPVLIGVDLHIASEWVGLVGPNGAGKTTFLRLVTRELSPMEGAISLEPVGARVVLCLQEVARITPEIGELARADDRLARRIQGSLRLDPGELDRWPTLSPGERKRWQIGAALAADPAVLLLDEPTNHIDANARSLLLEALRRFRGIGLIVSHDRILLEELTTSTLRFHKGRARLYRGPYSNAQRIWEAEERELIDSHQRVREEERRLRRRLGETRRAQAEATENRNAGRRMKGPRDHDATSINADMRAANAETKLSRSVTRLRNKLDHVAAEASAFHFEKGVGRSVFIDYVRAPSPWLFLLDAPEVRAGAETEPEGGMKVLGRVRLSVRRESRIRIVGPNGSGKTTLHEALLRTARIPDSKVLYVPQEISEERGLSFLTEARALPPIERGRVLSLVAALGVEPGRLLLSQRLSPGEARKLMIALGLGRHVWALVLDEPTNHMDLPSIERLESALGEYPGARILVTHDPSFARRATDEVWHVERGEVRVSSMDMEPAKARP